MFLILREASVTVNNALRVFWTMQVIEKEGGGIL